MVRGLTDKWDNKRSKHLIKENIRLGGHNLCEKNIVSHSLEGTGFTRETKTERHKNDQFNHIRKISAA